MIVTNLIQDLEPHLREAKEIWVAVALMNDNALEKIQSSIPEETIQHFLLGIDLPTSPTVFETLKEISGERISAAFFKQANTFHPKVYIIKKATEMVAFIGSANATMGGFSKNYEMNFCITRQEDCLMLLGWFNELNGSAKEITDEFIENYKIAYKRNRFWSSVQKSNLDNLFTTFNESALLDNIKEGQFFRQSDFDAFSPEFHTDTSEYAKERRSNVRDRFLELHDIIFPLFNEYGITDLHTPASRRNYTSQYFHSRGIINEKDALWLNYGKSESQLSACDDDTFTNNIRIQIILRNNEKEKYIGIWLFVGKPNKSIEDRVFIKERASDIIFINLFRALLQELGDSYWINIGEEEYGVSELDTRDLSGFLEADDFSDYYIIGRNYDPNSEDLSNENISETVLTEFSKLFKLYQLIKTE